MQKLLKEIQAFKKSADERNNHGRAICFDTEGVESGEIVLKPVGMRVCVAGVAQN